MGLMLGVELVRDRKTKEPANTEAADVLERCKDRGLLIGKGGCSATRCASNRRCASPRTTPILWWIVWMRCLPKLRIANNRVRFYNCY